MHEFIRSFIEREVWVTTAQGRKRYVVRQPTVREALCLLSCISDAVQEIPEARRLFFDTLSAWLPTGLRLIFCARDYPFNRVVAYVFLLINDGVPDFAAHKERMRTIRGDEDDAGKTTPEPQDEDDDPMRHLAKVANLPWEDYVAEYRAAYGGTLTEILNEPWNAFLFQSMKVDYIRAQRELSMLHAQSVPWIDDEKKRRREIDILLARAGGPVVTEEDRRQKLLDQQPEQLAKLEKQFALFQPQNKGEA